MFGVQEMFLRESSLSPNKNLKSEYENSNMLHNYTLSVQSFFLNLSYIQQSKAYEMKRHIVFSKYVG